LIAAKGIISYTNKIEDDSQERGWRKSARARSRLNTKKGAERRSDERKVLKERFEKELGQTSNECDSSSFAEYP